MNALHQQGITGNLWQLYNSMYTDITSVVKWNGELSRVFSEQQGIRQGGDSSADCYKGGKNKVLHNLDEAPSMKIGHIHAGAVMVADDLTIAARSPHEMQAALNIASQDANRERYKFNTEKTKTIVINSKDDPNLSINSQPLQTSTKEAHLGISRNAKNNNQDTVKDRVQSARTAAFSLMGAGLHGLNGTGPEVAKIQYNTYVTPTLPYSTD